jgi:hypothetical protein
MSLIILTAGIRYRSAEQYRGGQPLNILLSGTTTETSHSSPYQSTA